MKLNARAIELMLAERGATKSTLAEIAGISRQNISTIIRRGTAEPKTIGKIAKALGCDLVDIIEKE